jgi:hypothetical protein
LQRPWELKQRAHQLAARGHDLMAIDTGYRSLNQRRRFRAVPAPPAGFGTKLVVAVIRSGRAVSETVAGFAVSWWMVRAAVTEACLLQLPDVDKLSPRMLGIDEHRFRSARYFQDPTTKVWTRFEPG